MPLFLALTAWGVLGKLEKIIDPQRQAHA